MEVLDAMEARKSATNQPGKMRVQIGSIEHFFDRINVAAIILTGDLKVGDTIEIENEEFMVRQTVKSMQINRKDVDEASQGDDVGVKLSVPVPKGSTVYRLD
jgi:putative protease